MPLKQVPSAEIIKQAYQYYPCIEEDVWLDMLSQRNNMAHIYDGNAAKALASGDY
ncbi:MAG: nucleotidyltransferase substrate binding protein [Dysosmobacter sp.]